MCQCAYDAHLSLCWAGGQPVASGLQQEGCCEELCVKPTYTGSYKPIKLERTELINAPNALILVFRLPFASLERQSRL